MQALGCSAKFKIFKVHFYFFIWEKTFLPHSNSGQHCCPSSFLTSEWCLVGQVGTGGQVVFSQTTEADGEGGDEE